MVNSLIELLTPPNVVPKQRVVDNFDGDTLNERWNFTDINGTNSGSMDDSIDGGYTIITGTSSGNNAMINFNDKRHYSNTGSVIIAEIKAASAVDMYTIVGLTELDSDPGDTRITFHNDTSPTWQRFRTTLNSTSTSVDTSYSPDATRRTISMELRTASGVCWMDGVLEAISTSNLPDVKLQPYFRQGTRTSSAKTGHIRYLEAYNT